MKPQAAAFPGASQGGAPTQPGVDPYASPFASQGGYNPYMYWPAARTALGVPYRQQWAYAAPEGQVEPAPWTVQGGFGHIPRSWMSQGAMNALGGLGGLGGRRF